MTTPNHPANHMEDRKLLEDTDYPAAFTMQWAGKPVHVCPKHGRALMAINAAMGGGGLSWGGLLVPPEAPEGAQCENCKNEAAASIGEKL